MVLWVLQYFLSIDPSFYVCCTKVKCLPQAEHTKSKLAASKTKLQANESEFVADTSVLEQCQMEDKEGREYVASSVVTPVVAVLVVSALLVAVLVVSALLVAVLVA